MCTIGVIVMSSENARVVVVGMFYNAHLASGRSLSKDHSEHYSPYLN